MAKNVQWKVDENNILHISVDLSEDFGPSNSGKTIIVATTEGSVKLDVDTSMGLNVYRSRNRTKWLGKEVR